MPPPGTVQQTLAELLRLMPDADLRPGSMLRSLTEAAHQAGQELDVVQQGELLRTYLGAGLYQPYVPLQVSHLDLRDGRPRGTPYPSTLDRHPVNTAEVYRRLYATDPLVGAAIDLHRELPLSAATLPDQMTRHQAMSINFGRIYGGRQAGRTQRAAEAAVRLAVRTQWHVDPQNGNDENDGSPEAPIRTFAEFNRRNSSVDPTGPQITINVMGDVPATDPIVGLGSGTRVLGLPPPATATVNRAGGLPMSLDEAAAIRRMRDEIMAEEDAEVFRRLDQIAQTAEIDPDYRPIDVSWVQNPTDPRAMLDRVLPPVANPPGFTMQELPGAFEVNPRAVEGIQGRRVTMPLFEIASNPTIHLSELRHRRMITREDEQVPVPRVQDMSPQQMQEIALIIRRTAWERLMRDPEF